MMPAYTTFKLNKKYDHLKLEELVASTEYVSHPTELTLQGYCRHGTREICHKEVHRQLY